MKKVYFLFLLICSGFMAGAQITDTIWAIGPTGSFTTGSSIQNVSTGVYTRAEDIIPVANSTTTRQTGYAVFDLSSIPSTATVSYVELGVNIFGYTSPSGPTGTCNTYGRTGSLATVTNANTLYTNCTTGGTLLSNLTYGNTAPYDWKITNVSSVALLTFISNQVAIVGHQYITTTFTTSGSTTGPVYNIKGQAGSRATAGPHAPYLIITYCFKPVINSVSINPTTICSGSTFTVSATTTGAANYRWRGPGGYNSGLLTAVTGLPDTATRIATAASQGVYTLTAYTACGTYADSSISTATFPTSTTLTVSPSPDTIVVGSTTACVGNVIYMSNQTAGGAWSSSNTNLATVSSTGMVTTIAGGRPFISYKLGVCASTDTLTINTPPTAIIGGHEVCANGGTLALSDAVAGIPNGTWSSSVPAAATVDPVTGVVYGVVPGVTDISYTNAACPAVTHSVTVNPLPSPITGPITVCVNATIALTDPSTGGTWSSTSTTVTVNALTGAVTGVAAGAATVSYVLPTGCYVTKAITVNPIPDPITGPSSVCEGGGIITLSESSTGGTWSSSSTPTATITTAGVVTGVAAGSTNISYIFASNGCFVTHPVTVNPLPNTITGLDLVCTNATITLSDAAVGGTWSSGSTTVASVNPSTGEVLGVSAGISWITYTLATACYTSHSVTVLPLPPAVITPVGPTTFCTGGSVTLNANTGTFTYQWFSNHTPIIGANTATYVSNSTEIVEVQVTDGNGCVHLSDSEQVTLIPAVAILAGGPTVFCQPGNVMLSVPLAPGILYQWKLDGVNIAGATAHNFMAVSDGTYTADLVIPGGCASTTPPFLVTVHPMPVPVISFSGVVLTTPPGFLNYQWFLNTVAIPGATSTSVTPTVNGSYIVRVQDGNGCIGYSNSFIFNLGVGQVSATNVNIYPNPANTVVNIDASVDVRAVITSVDGKTLIDQQNAKQVDISKLSNGLYMIILYNKEGDRLMISKLVKE